MPPAAEFLEQAAGTSNAAGGAVAGRDECHLHPLDELPHHRGEIRSDLVGVELLSTLGGAEAFLEDALTVGAWLVPVIIAHACRREGSGHHV
jgi:hypothetical protein